MMLLSKRQRAIDQYNRPKRPTTLEKNLSFTSRTSKSSHPTAPSVPHQKLQEIDCVRKLREGCRLVKIPLSASQIFRFACYCNFDYELARTTLMEKFDDPHLHLPMEGELLHQFESRILFPLPGLKTKNCKQEVLYFHGARHFPSKESTELLIKNMCYVLNSMSVTEEQSRNGVVFIINLDLMKLENFRNESIGKFLTAMEHQVPTRVEKVFFVNVASWCLSTWKSLTKTVVSKSFAKKFHFLRSSNELGWYLMEGYEEYLPKELGYWRDSNEIVEDFIDKKLHEEQASSN